MFRKTFNKKLISITVAVAAMFSLTVIPAFAVADPGVVIAGGDLSGGDVTFADFTAITLDGTEKTSTANWVIANVVDPRGTGAGWNLTLALTQFKEFEADYVAEGKTLATSSIKITTVLVVSKADETSSAVETITVVDVNTALDTGSPVGLLSAAADGGMGSYIVSDMVATLTIPANTYARTYKTDATVALVTGP